MNKNNRNKVVYIHIPKCGGTYILNVLYNSNSFNPEHKQISKYNTKNKIVLSSIRNPISFYESYYNFLKYPNHRLFNKMSLIAKTFDHIDKFLKDLLNKNIKTNLKLLDMDKYYFQAKNNYGLLTNYILFYFNYNGDHSEADIYKFIKNLKKKVTFVKMENLTQSMINFSNKHQIELYKKHLHKRINKNVKKERIADEYVKILIYLKERPIFDLFDYKL